MITVNALVLILFGGGSFTLDAYLMKSSSRISKWKYWDLLAAYKEPDWSSKFIRGCQFSAVLVTMYVMIMHQVHHGGLWGKLHNYSTQPDIQIEYIANTDDTLTFSVYRDKGPETYGDFITKLEIIDKRSQDILLLSEYHGLHDLSMVIDNIYINKVRLGVDHLVIPLGAKANLSISHQNLKGQDVIIRLTNIQGKQFVL